MAQKNKVSDAVQIRKELSIADKIKEPFETKRGITIRMLPAPPLALEKARNAVKAPKVPTFVDDNGKQHDNPDHPDYIKALEDYRKAQNDAVVNALIEFGVELVDPLPDDDTWLRKLQRSNVIPEGTDLDDQLELEFWYKQYALSVDEISLLTKLAQISPDEIDERVSSFRDT